MKTLVAEQHEISGEFSELYRVTNQQTAKISMLLMHMEGIVLLNNFF
jgi:hypothetical protein